MIGWGWFYLSTVVDDYSRYMLAWKLCDGMTARDVSDTLSLFEIPSTDIHKTEVQSTLFKGEVVYQAPD